LSPFALFDRAAQAVVDRTMFALMRSTGWARSLIRYRITCVLVLGLHALGCLAVPSILFAAFLLVSGVAVISLGAARERRRDEAAERRGMAQELCPSRWTAVFVIAICVSGQPDAALMAWAWRGLVDMFVDYARATPPAPPAKRHLVLARSTS
jgi:hypothetical protein